MRSEAEIRQKVQDCRTFRNYLIENDLDPTTVQLEIDAYEWVLEDDG